MAALLFSSIAQADLIDIVNDIRRTGCSSHGAATKVIDRDAALDTAAKLIARGSEIDAALAQLDYRAVSATLINIGGADDNAAIREVLADGFCVKVNSETYTDIGTYVLGNEFWLVLAAHRLDSAGDDDTHALVARGLELVNEARSQGRRCGQKWLRATHPLKLSMRLTQVATAHAADMAANGYVGHRGSDGSDAGERVSRAGYRWRSVGENVAAGQYDAETVVREWLLSPGHCANIMGPQFTEIGVAVIFAPQSDLRVLWAHVLATSL